MARPPPLIGARDVSEYRNDASCGLSCCMGRSVALAAAHGAPVSEGARASHFAVLVRPPAGVLHPRRDRDLDGGSQLDPADRSVPSCRRAGLGQGELGPFAVVASVAGAPLGGGLGRAVVARAL